MITFTGAVIGYVTNYISNFIENANSGARALKVSGHTVILNWNSRASEIVNDLLYTGDPEVIVIIVSENGEAVERELNDRISSTLRQEQEYIRVKYAGKPIQAWRHRVRNRLSIIIREGETYSTKQLQDVSVLQAKTVIILGNDDQNSVCKYANVERQEQNSRGNSNTTKTLVQVAEMTSSEESADNQVIVVEVEDNWTLNLVNKIIAHKERLGKCNIIAVPVNRVLGQILSQFSVMPELNTVYSELFSNKGAEFFCKEHRIPADENKDIREYMKTHLHSIPMTCMKTATGPHSFYIADQENEIVSKDAWTPTGYSVKVNPDYWIEQRNIIIVGHNSKSRDIMVGFNDFRSEWNNKDGNEILNILVIDNKKGLESMDYFKEYPYVNKVVEAEIFDGAAITKAIVDFIDENNDDASILILSDDTVAAEDIDASALAYLVYVQDIIFERVSTRPDFHKNSVDVIVEILNPKNYDVAHHYNVDNVVISNRYISRMVTQISRKEALYEFYADILTYDEAGAEEYESKELYAKKVSSFFKELPGPCNAGELIRAVFDATPENDKAIVIGYADAEGKTTLFSGDQRSYRLSLTEKDKIIVFCNH